MSKQQKREHLINEDITYSEVRVGDNILKLKDALTISYDTDKDLILINDRTDPPICLMEEYNKFLFELRKKEKQKRANQVIIETKELRFSPNIGENDFNIKVKKAEEFINDGDKVKVTILFKNRELQYKERGEILLNKFYQSLETLTKLEEKPKMDGRRMFIILSKK